MVAGVLLATWLLSQSWSWDRSPDVDVVAYRIYWSDLATEWCETQRAEVTPDCWEDTPGTWRCQGDVPEPSWPLAFFLVTAVDGAGNEGDGEHGPINPVCP